MPVDQGQHYHDRTAREGGRPDQAQPFEQLTDDPAIECQEQQQLDVVHRARDSGSSCHSGQANQPAAVCGSDSARVPRVGKYIGASQ